MSVSYKFLRHILVLKNEFFLLLYWSYVVLHYLYLFLYLNLYQYLYLYLYLYLYVHL
jgi:hypothetical protein